MSSAEIVICGAGMAGIATAYHLAVKHGFASRGRFAIGLYHGLAAIARLRAYV
jgi:glycine/D-amino acid oxidase-like deaminating enzyme